MYGNYQAAKLVEVVAGVVELLAASLQLVLTDL